MSDVPPSPASAATAPEARTFSVGLMITRARRLIWSTANRRLQPLGETILEWPIYSHIACLGPSSQRDMAAAIAQDPASVCRLAEDMESRGLVTRTRDPGDRRKVTVDLTAAGRERHARMYPEVVAAIDECLAPLSPQECDQLASLLEKVLGPRP